MKMMFCGECVTIKSLEPFGRETLCRCGQMSARWVDPRAGTVAVAACDREMARVIGLHNTYMRFAFETTKEFAGDATVVRYPSHGEWRAFHRHVTAALSEGYLFHKDTRDCPFVILRVGQSNDTFWEDELPPEVRAQDEARQALLKRLADPEEVRSYLREVLDLGQAEEMAARLMDVAEAAWRYQTPP